MFKKTFKFLGFRFSLLFLVIVLVILAIVFGLMLGYGGLGGGKATRIFSPSLWEDFFKKLNP